MTKTWFKCCAKALISCLALLDLDSKETAQGLLSWLHLPARSTEEQKKVLPESQQRQSKAGTGISATSHSTAGLCTVVRCGLTWTWARLGHLRCSAPELTGLPGATVERGRVSLHSFILFLKKRGPYLWWLLLMYGVLQLFIQKSKASSFSFAPPICQETKSKCKENVWLTICLGVME